ncbi:MAG: biotin/lipoyl-binding protein [Sedimentibacter sp.]
MKQNIKYVIIVLCVLFSMTACAPKSDELLSQEEIKPVKVKEVKEETIPIDMIYMGIVSGKEIKKYSFKSSGKIAEFYVQKGDKVIKDQMLVQLDTQELLYAAEGAKAQYDAALAQYNKASNGATEEDVNKAEQNVNKAQLAYTYSNETYKQTLALYEQGAVSEDTLEKAKLDAEIKSSDLAQAKQVEQEVKKGTREEDKQTLYNQLKSAEINYESKKSMLDDGAILADMDGYIVDVLYKEGEG